MVTLCCGATQAWGVLEAKAGNVQLARQLYKCAVKADPSSEAAWLVRGSNSHLQLAEACQCTVLYYLPCRAKSRQSCIL